MTYSLRISIALCVLVAFAPKSEGGGKSPIGKLTPKKLDKAIKVNVRINYLLYLPPGYGKDKKQWPLVLFLHGAGESGNNLERVKIHGPPKLIAKGKKFPFILVAPQSARFGWNTQALNGLLQEVIAKHNVDEDRVYCTGLSMGGFGTWSMAAEYPNRFAAIVPICGGGSTRTAKRIKHLPIWVFHGGKDTVVRPSRSKSMVDALKRTGAKSVQYTLYPNAGHDSWTETYNNEKMWSWLLKQRRAVKR